MEIENFKNIHLGRLLKQRVDECRISNERICNFFKCDSIKINHMYNSESIDVMDLLRWSKLLEYDFFRLYSQHLILYSPPGSESEFSSKLRKTKLPSFRKNIYTKELIDFIIQSLNNGKKTKDQIINQYKIPKTTLYKWLKKYNDKNE
ncbi:transposase [Chryseobacterium gambrini]|uniref:Transposase n=1 Tax=Chryseobacterium gambrini TaxID=373672 RepID=A0ABM8K8L7_9FLAO|nr:transposase [Chryseobacterium gambrini]